MTEKIEIRPLRKSDVKEACRMIKVFAAGFGDKATVSERDLLVHCFGKTKIATILLAFIDKKPVGFAITREWMNFYWGIKFRHIDFVFVENKYRKTGIASALIKFVAQTAVKDGCKRLSLDVGNYNKATISLYKKLGFEKRSNISTHYRLSKTSLRRLAGRKAKR